MDTGMLYIYEDIFLFVRSFGSLFFILVIATQGKKGITIKRIKTSLISSKNYKFYSNERFFLSEKIIFGTSILCYLFPTFKIRYEHWVLRYFADRDGLILYLIRYDRCGKFMQTIFDLIGVCLLYSL